MGEDSTHQGAGQEGNHRTRHCTTRRYGLIKKVHMYTKSVVLSQDQLWAKKDSVQWEKEAPRSAFTLQIPEAFSGQPSLSSSAHRGPEKQTKQLCLSTHLPKEGVKQLFLRDLACQGPQETTGRPYLSSCAKKQLGCLFSEGWPTEPLRSRYSSSPTYPLPWEAVKQPTEQVGPLKTLWNSLCSLWILTGVHLGTLLWLGPYASFRHWELPSFALHLSVSTGMVLHSHNPQKLMEAPVL